MDSFRVRLEACDPAQGRFRAYRIEADTDLLGDWLVDVTYGRIGSCGRTVRYIASDEAAARKLVRHCLQRRATAPKRIGVAYRLRELTDPGRWIAGPSGDGDRAMTVSPWPCPESVLESNSILLSTISEPQSWTSAATSIR